ncbi:hypothetical protein ACFWPA_13440 [Rhodococcus sp. NPDC058505]|uniref:hypothetical protein n=1 Tax=unclassified Rhodococcus (in: high G+C Gram-positive bacteria) TaxID=192944 RepID=UPI003663431B
MPSTTPNRIVGGAAVAAATAAALAFALPATAAAAPTTQPPTVVASSSDTSITMKVTNTNAWDINVPWCQAFVVNAAEVPAVVDDPTHLFDPGVLVYPALSAPLSMFGVAPKSTVTNTVNDLEPGVYGVIGGCARAFDLIHPVLGEPQMMQVGLLPGGSSDGSTAMTLPFGS